MKYFTCLIFLTVVSASSIFVPQDDDPIPTPILAVKRPEKRTFKKHPAPSKGLSMRPQSHYAFTSRPAKVLKPARNHYNIAKFVILIFLAALCGKFYKDLNFLPFFKSISETHELIVADNSRLLTDRFAENIPQVGLFELDYDSVLQNQPSFSVVPIAESVEGHFVPEWHRQVFQSFYSSRNEEPVKMRSEWTREDWLQLTNSYFTISHNHRNLNSSVLDDSEALQSLVFNGCDSEECKIENAFLLEAAVQTRKQTPDFLGEILLKLPELNIDSLYEHKCIGVFIYLASSQKYGHTIDRTGKMTARIMNDSYFSDNDVFAVAFHETFVSTQVAISAYLTSRPRTFYYACHENTHSPSLAGIIDVLLQNPANPEQLEMSKNFFQAVASMPEFGKILESCKSADIIEYVRKLAITAESFDSQGYGEMFHQDPDVGFHLYTAILDNLYDNRS